MEKNPSTATQQRCCRRNVAHDLPWGVLYLLTPLRHGRRFLEVSLIWQRSQWCPHVPIWTQKINDKGAALIKETTKTVISWNSRLASVKFERDFSTENSLDLKVKAQLRPFWTRCTMGGSQNHDCEILLGTSTQNHKKYGENHKNIENLENHNGSPKKNPSDLQVWDLWFFWGEGPWWCFYGFMDSHR